MIQIFAKRDTTAVFELLSTAPSHQHLLENLPDYLAQIPENERYNLFFTHAQCTENAREFKEQWVIPFDMDGIDTTRACSYRDVFASVLGLGTGDFFCISSGHGLHLGVTLKTPFTKREFFDQKRLHYKAICARIDALLKSNKLPGHMDTDFWKPTIFFRLPGTENRKKGPCPAPVALLGHGFTRLDFDWERVSGLPDILPNEQVDIKNYPSIDTQGVLEGCEFIKHCKLNPNQVNEPQWYAMLSILGKLQNGQKLCHDYSEGHKGYNYDETELKREQALSASGPRTCKNIGSLFSGCRQCSYYQRISSPITIQGPDFIETSGTGFHSTKVGKNGAVTVGKPVYEDLRKYFNSKHPYLVLGKSKLCLVAKTTHFEEMEDIYIENFGQTHFQPTARNQMINEFKQLTLRTNVVSPDWFQTSTEKRINFFNGVLDLRTGELLPHSPKYGFRYVLPYAYEPDATCPTFEKFLHQVTNGDGDLSNVLMEFAGYAFSGDFPWASKVLVLTGEGSNGKSTFIDVLRALAGTDNYSSLTWKDMNNPTNLQLIDGKLFNLAEEAPKNALNDSTLFKNLATGGEITVNMKYKQPYQIRNKTKLIFACNELPKSEDTTEGYFRRFLIVPFFQEFSDEIGNIDKDIRVKLFQELPGIFNLVLKGYDRLNRNKKFTDCQAATKRLNEYRLELDHGTRWIRENSSIQPLNGGQKYAVITEMYQAYRMEMQNSGEVPISAQSFGKKLVKEIPDYQSRVKYQRVNGRVHRVLSDVTFQNH